VLFRVLDKAEIGDLVAGFAQRYSVIAPVRHQDSYRFENVSDDLSRIVYDYDTTILPPKKYLLPPTTELFSFSTTQNDVSFDDSTVTPEPRVLFGLHACDINAINRLDQVFLDSEYVDPYYEAQRSVTMVVGISCMPTSHCFCNVWHSDEVNQGFDMFLYDLGDRYLVTIMSVDAAEILSQSTNAREAVSEDSVAFQRRVQEFKDAFAPFPDASQLSMLMYAYYQDPLWDELGERCLSCTACSVVCPTCYCFDIRDVLSPSGEDGVRVRTWDSCCSPDFEIVAGGRNFEGTAAARVRHRFYHKFLGYLNRTGEMLCTGCGRCEIACKAKITPRVVIDALQNRITTRDTSADSCHVAARVEQEGGAR
jgi:sulfhydrogenase subunit beta (sulfur reductase)